MNLAQLHVAMKPPGRIPKGWVFARLALDAEQLAQST